MSDRLSNHDDLEIAARRKRSAEADHLQALEGNPLTAEEKAMFEMFDREGWSDERRRAYILAQFSGEADISAAE